MLGRVLLYLSWIDMGMAEMDESFYLTIPLRLTQGDARMDEYAKCHPEKTPDVIYVDADSKGRVDR